MCSVCLINNYITRWCSHPRVIHRCITKITLHSAAAEERINNYITFLDPGGINYVIIVGPTVGSVVVRFSCGIAKNLARQPVSWMRGKDPHPQDFSLTKKTAVLLRANFVLTQRKTKGQQLKGKIAS